MGNQKKTVKKAMDLVQQGKMPVANLARLKEKFPEIAEKQMIQTADKLMTDKRYKEAAEIYCQLNMAKEAGNAFRQAGDFRKAAEWYKKAGMEIEAARQLFECGAVSDIEKAAKVFFDNKMNRELIDCVHALIENYPGYIVVIDVIDLCIEAGLGKELIKELKEEEVFEKVLLAKIYLALGDEENAVKMIGDFGRARIPKDNRPKLFDEQATEICILIGYEHLLEFARKAPEIHEKRGRYQRILYALDIAQKLRKGEKPDYIPEELKCLEKPEVRNKFLGTVGNLGEAHLTLYDEIVENYIKLGEHWDRQPRYDVHYQQIGMQTTPGKTWKTPTGAERMARSYYLEAARYLIKARRFEEAEKLIEKKHLYNNIIVELARAYEKKGMLNEAGEAVIRYKPRRTMYGEERTVNKLAEAERLFNATGNKDGLRKVAEEHAKWNRNWKEAIRIYLALGDGPAARKTALLAAEDFIEGRGWENHFNEKFEMIDNLLIETGATPDQRADFYRGLVGAIEKKQEGYWRRHYEIIVYRKFFELIKKEKLDGPETEEQVREKLFELYMKGGMTDKAMEVIE